MKKDKDKTNDNDTTRKAKQAPSVRDLPASTRQDAGVKGGRPHSDPGDDDDK